MTLKRAFISFLIIQAALIGLSFCGASDCNGTSPLTGCISCSITTNLTLNASSNKFTCTNITNCIMVDSQENCIQCSSGYVLNITIDSNNTVIGSTCFASNKSFFGCKTYTNGTCTACISNLYYLNNGTCQLRAFDYCWKINATLCSQCSDENVVNSSNCSISKSICDTFDYHKWVCSVCPPSYTLHQSGIFCYNATDRQNCLVIGASSCLQCNVGYFINGSQCQLDSSFLLEFQLLPTSYYYDSSATTKKVCLDYGTSWDSATLSCKANPSTISYCLTPNSTNASQCIQCVQSSYLSSSLCYPCDSQHSNCLLCDASNCYQCIPTYYLVLQSNNYSISQVLSGIASPNATKCLPCSIYSCKYCRSQFDSNGNFNVRCDKCLFGYKLHNHTCISCPINTYFSQNLRVCSPCNDANCMYCNTDKYTCDQCIDNMYFNGSLCVSMTPIITGRSFATINASKNSIYEILNKSLPYSSTNIINDVKLLMTYCAGSSNGFACLCQSNGNTSFSSLCYPINTDLALTPLTISQFVSNVINSTKYPTSYIQQKSDLLVLLSELPKFDWEYYNNFSASQLISNTQFANYLQITSNYIRNHPSNMNTSADAISQLVFNKLYKSFDPYQPTIFSGPGYYFKYTPQSPTKDDTSVVSLSSNTVASVAFIYFNSTIDSTIQRITGTAFVFLNQQTSTQLNMQIKKISFLGSNQNYVVMFNDKVQGLTVSSDTDGYVTINNISTSTNSVNSANGTYNAYYVSSTTNNYLADQFANQRIENLIYRVAFIYILIFLTLYLTLVPFCALFDCVDNKSHKRKIKTNSEEGSYQGIKHRSQNQIEDEIALKINYKDFFPIYNIANTDRPRRLLKLCLFLVNSQHSITFLSLIYFNLPGGQPLIAVLLAIPAYICTVIMGYLCGLFTLKIPGKLKYLINLVTLGYWILWIPIMSSFLAYQYAPYVFTFAIIFFFIDMLIDFLETLLMYFTIKQQSRQIKLFKALSRWLSYRGYYEFDKMAKEIDQVRDNS